MDDFFDRGDWICAGPGTSTTEAGCERWIRRYFVCACINGRWFGRVESAAVPDRQGRWMLPVTSPAAGRTRSLLAAAHFRRATKEEAMKAEAVVSPSKPPG